MLTLHLLLWIYLLSNLHDPCLINSSSEIEVMSDATDFCMPKLSFASLVCFEMVGTVYILKKFFLLLLKSKGLRNLGGS